jgi:EPS-associated MarR family transcriptional regulator
MSQDDLHYQLLRELTREPAASQRNLATGLGVSVGKVNYCLRALVAKGWIKVNNFRRSDNKWAYVYLLTPTGMAAKVRLTKEFLEKKERDFESLHAEIEQLRSELPEGPASRPASDAVDTTSPL